MPPIFFQKYWHIIKSDVINCVLNILNDRVLDPNLNFTHIVLILKIHKTELITHFHPINLCNVIMRITTKCIANRLKPLFDKIIALTLSVFVPGRLIIDNMVYGKASGQEINLEKSMIVFSKNTADNLRSVICEGLGIRQADKHEKYLGLPSLAGRSRKAVFNSLRDKVWNKISLWGEKELSQASKEVLIKAVIQAIPTYVIGVSQLPEGLIRDIEGMIASFWWNSTEN
ncbi:UNVERIFIED_CONTAM: hypothetical protein Sradi_6238400 [Sesamum radiatum]|uniref:Reverse transcriptase n=1 Tax=Sesamum radiatum TaxID=300843 RepID=A0AAW2KBE9_SESRA